MIIKKNLTLCDPLEEYVFRIVACGDAIGGKEWCAREVSPPYTRIYYMLDGEGQIETPEGNITLREGNLYIIPAGFSFSYSCKSQMRQLYFHVNLTGSGGYDLLRGINQIISQRTDPSHVKELLSLYDKKDKMNSLLLKAILQNDLFDALKNAKVAFGASEPSDCIKRALRYIEEHLSVSLTICEIAKELFISPDTLSHRFKKEMGESVGKYIDGLIFYKAEQFLAGSELPLAQISSELGFYDQFYFSRRFKEKFGIPPLKYRKNHRSLDNPST